MQMVVPKHVVFMGLRGVYREVGYREFLNPIPIEMISLPEGPREPGEDEYYFDEGADVSGREVYSSRSYSWLKSRPDYEEVRRTDRGFRSEFQIIDAPDCLGITEDGEILFRQEGVIANLAIATFDVDVMGERIVYKPVLICRPKYLLCLGDKCDDDGPYYGIIDRNGRFLTENWKPQKNHELECAAKLRNRIFYQIWKELGRPSIKDIKRSPRMIRRLAYQYGLNMYMMSDVERGMFDDALRFEQFLTMADMYDERQRAVE